MREEIKELFDGYMYAYLENDSFMSRIILTRLNNEYNKGNVNSGDLFILRDFVLDEVNNEKA